MAGVKLSSADLEGATEIAPVKLTPEDLAGAEELTAAPSRQVHGGVAGPGSTDPDEPSPMAEAPRSPLERLAPAPSAHHNVDPRKWTPAEARRNADPVANDPAAQMVLGGVLGAGAGALAAPILGAALPAAVARVGVGAIEGGTSSKAMGGDFTTGAALGGAIPAVPLVGRTLTRAAKASADAARSIGEGAVERSAARGAAPIASAIKDSVAHAVKNGHVVVPSLRVGAVAADEAAAALARRMGVKAPVAPEPLASPSVNEPTGPAQQAGWDPEGWKYDQAKPVESARAEAPEIAPAPEEPAIAAAREALKDPNVTKEQADALKKAIAGYQAKAARRAPVETSPAAPDADTDVAATPPSGARPEQWGGRAPNLERPTPEWSPSDDDVKFAKRLGTSVEEYRALMERRAKQSAGYNAAVDTLARAARRTTKLADFVREAVPAGIGADDARRIWEAAHRGGEAVAQ